MLSEGLLNVAGRGIRLDPVQLHINLEQHMFAAAHRVLPDMSHRITAMPDDLPKLFGDDGVELDVARVDKSVIVRLRDLPEPLLARCLWWKLRQSGPIVHRGGKYLLHRRLGLRERQIDEALASAQVFVVGDAEEDAGDL